MIKDFKRFDDELEEDFDALDEELIDDVDDVSEEDDDDFDPIVDGLVNMLRKLPPNLLKTVNADKFNQMMRAAALLKTLLAECDCKGMVEISVDETFSSGAVSVNVKEIAVRNIPLFIKAVSNADNFEIFPKTDGSIQFAMSFNSILKTEVVIDTK